MPNSRPGTAAYAEVPKLADIQIRAMEKWVGGGANSITSSEPPTTSQHIQLAWG
jgi:hypothetical protein